MAESEQAVLGWAVEYAKSGKSKCQVTKQLIDAGSVRIGKEVDNPFKAGTTMKLWFAVDALFDSFRKGSVDKTRITSVDELVGFDDLKKADQKKLTSLIEAETEFRQGLAEVDADAIRLEHEKNGGVFWSVVQNENTTRVKWGAIGESGVVSEKEHKDEAAATKFVNTKIKEKEKGGYVRVDGADIEGGGGESASPVKPKKEPKKETKATKKKTKKQLEEAVKEEEAEAPPPKKAKKEPAAKKKEKKETKEEVEAPKVKKEPAATTSSIVHDKVHGWAVEYAKSGKSKCKATNELIEKGSVRIGMEVDNPFKAGTTMKIWFKVDALFASFRKGAADKPRINIVDDLVGFDVLKKSDQKNITALVDEENTFREGLAEVDADAIRLEHDKNGGVFWSVVQSGHTTRVKWGAIGESGVVSEKEHKDEAAATKFVNTKIKEKEKGGYKKVE